MQNRLRDSDHVAPVEPFVDKSSPSLQVVVKVDRIQAYRDPVLSPGQCQENPPLRHVHG